MPRILDRSNHKAAGLGQSLAAYTQQVGQTQGLIAQLQQRDEQDQRDIAAANERAQLQREQVQSATQLNQARAAQIEQETQTQAQASQLTQAFVGADEQAARDFLAESQGDAAAAAFDALPPGRVRERVIRETMEQVEAQRVAQEKQELLERIGGSVGTDQEPGLYSPEEVDQIQDVLNRPNPGITLVELERDFARREERAIERDASMKTGEINIQAMTQALADPQVLERLDPYEGKEKANALLSRYQSELRYRPDKVDHQKFLVDFEMATSSPGLQGRIRQAEMRASAAERALSTVTGLQPEELQGLIVEAPTTPGRAQLQRQKQITPVSELAEPDLRQIMTRLRNVAAETPEDMGDEQLSQILVQAAARMGVQITPEEIFNLIPEGSYESEEEAVLGGAPSEANIDDRASRGSVK